MRQKPAERQDETMGIAMDGAGAMGTARTKPALLLTNPSEINYNAGMIWPGGPL